MPLDRTRSELRIAGIAAAIGVVLGLKFYVELWALDGRGFSLVSERLPYWDFSNLWGGSVMALKGHVGDIFDIDAYRATLRSMFSPQSARSGMELSAFHSAAWPAVGSNADFLGLPHLDLRYDRAALSGHAPARYASVAAASVLGQSGNIRQRHLGPEWRAHCFAPLRRPSSGAQAPHIGRRSARDFNDQAASRGACSILSACQRQLSRHPCRELDRPYAWLSRPASCLALKFGRSSSRTPGRS